MPARLPIRSAAVAFVACVGAASLIAPASASADYAHVVSAGETLSSVAAVDGLSVSAVAAANGLSTTAELVAGSVLEIPPRRGAASATTAASSADTGGASSQTGSGSYIVQPGDTLTAIAERDDTTIAALALLNGLNSSGTLDAGVTLRLPVASDLTPVTHSVSSSVASGAAAETPSLVATDEYVSAAEIGQIAQGNGVPPALAEAIAWQESGFNNDEVSADGAVGVMQITPAAWETIERSAGGTLSTASAASNITAGVLLLHSLLAATGSEAEAVAAYYQGLSSLQKVGLYPATVVYVADVMALAQRFAA